MLHHLYTLIGALALAAASAAPVQAQNATPAEPATPQAPAGEPWRAVTFGTTLESTNVADALIDFARNEGVTHVIFGQTKRSRWHQLVHGSVVDRFLQEVRSATVQVVPLGDGDGSDM